ncbi:MAG: HNH endonuclease [candidate division Zixibacteria bacterium]|nr:HNH endonuclease [candidate division Zixibacteria bacterium]
MNKLNRHVLVLNQNFEPLSVCSARRAVVMTYLGKADIVETYDGLGFSSVKSFIPLPSVVKLDIYVKVPHKRIVLTRKNIIKRDNHTCQYCGRKDRPMTVDHIIPKQYDGKDTWENLVCACVKCNNKKSNKTPEQANLKLRSKPKRPNHITFIKQFIGISDERWKRYLFLD